MRLSPSERQRRSDLAKRLHAEGKLGGRGPARKSAEVRARRASEISDEIVAKHRIKIEKAIVKGLESPNVSHRLKAAELALKMGMASERLDASVDRAEAENRSREELIEAIVGKMNAPTVAGGLIRARLRESFVDGTATDIRDAGS